MRSAVAVALGVLLPGVALAEDPCDAVFLDGPEATMETDGVSYNGNQSKLKIPDGCILAGRQAILDAGITEGYFAEHLAFHTAEVIYDMPGCATWRTAKLNWSHVAGDWVVYVTTYLEAGEDGAPRLQALSPDPPRELPELMGADQAREAMAICGELREDEAPWVGYCLGTQHVCTDAYSGGDDGDGVHAYLDLETEEVTCSPAGILTPGGQTGDDGASNDGAATHGAAEATGCGAGQAPASALALLLLLGLRRRSTPGRA